MFFAFFNGGVGVHGRIGELIVLFTCGIDHFVLFYGLLPIAFCLWVGWVCYEATFYGLRLPGYFFFPVGFLSLCLCCGSEGKDGWGDGCKQDFTPEYKEKRK